jgi:hypothetical protein
VVHHVPHDLYELPGALGQAPGIGKEVPQCHWEETLRHMMNRYPFFCLMNRETIKPATQKLPMMLMGSM